jgi:hypothetical protein
VVVPWVCLCPLQPSCPNPLFFIPPLFLLEWGDGISGKGADVQQIARDHPDEIQVMNHQSFFWPMWYGSEIEDTHEKDEYNFRATGQYA